MKINSIQSTNINSKGIRISSDSNKNVKYLYNKVMEIDRELKIPATYHANEIELPTATNEVLQRLKQFGIVYKEIVKGEETKGKEVERKNFKPVIVNYQKS